MGWLGSTVFVLGIIYAAALTLTLADRIAPRAPYVPNQGPRQRRHRGWLILWAPLAAFGLIMWAIVYGPVLLWRRILGRSA
jgi:hypothetical protein